MSVKKRTRFPTNLLLASLMDKPSCEPGCCAVCGAPRGITSHHIVPRSQGGLDGPTIDLCGHGTTGCHGDAEEKRIHFRWHDDWWQFLITEAPMKYQDALQLEGWRRVL
jgi:5-methylcytosine-specific restriction endonuclease McrA